MLQKCIDDFARILINSKIDAWEILWRIYGLMYSHHLWRSDWPIDSCENVEIGLNRLGLDPDVTKDVTNHFNKLVDILHKNVEIDTSKESIIHQLLTRFSDFYMDSAIEKDVIMSEFFISLELSFMANQIITHN